MQKKKNGNKVFALGCNSEGRKKGVFGDSEEREGGSGVHW